MNEQHKKLYKELRRLDRLLKERETKTQKDYQKLLSKLDSKKKEDGVWISLEEKECQELLKIWNDEKKHLENKTKIIESILDNVKIIKEQRVASPMLKREAPIDLSGNVRKRQRKKKEEPHLIPSNPLDPTLPIRKGRAKPLTGAKKAPPEYIIPRGAAVAAKTGESMWILTTVVRFLPEKVDQYEVVDADPYEDVATRKHYTLPRKCIIPLPTTQPEQWSKATCYPKSSMVLAMFPNTTAFYPAVVQGCPTRGHPDYVLIFDDDEENGKKST